MKKFIFDGIPKTTIKAYNNAVKKQGAKCRRVIVEFEKGMSEKKEEAEFYKVLNSMEKKHGIMLCPWVWLRKSKGKENAWGFDVLADGEEE